MIDTEIILREIENVTTLKNASIVVVVIFFCYNVNKTMQYPFILRNVEIVFVINCINFKNLKRVLKGF